MVRKEILARSAAVALLAVVCVPLASTGFAKSDPPLPIRAQQADLGVVRHDNMANPAAIAMLGAGLLTLGFCLKHRTGR